MEEYIKYDVIVAVQIRFGLTVWEIFLEVCGPKQIPLQKIGEMFMAYATQGMTPDIVEHWCLCKLGWEDQIGLA